MPVKKKPTKAKKKSLQRVSQKSLEDMTEEELQREVLAVTPWDTDTEFFHDWCQENDVFLDQENLTRQLMWQDKVGKIVGGLALGLIFTSFISAVFSRI